MKRPSDEDILLMDEIISNLKMYESIDYHGYPNNDRDILNGRIIDFVEQNENNIGQIIQGISLRCNQHTLNFVKSGGFKEYYSEQDLKLSEESKVEIKNQKLIDNQLELTRRQIIFHKYRYSWAIAFIILGSALTFISKIIYDHYLESIA